MFQTEMCKSFILNGSVVGLCQKFRQMICTNIFEDNFPMTHKEDPKISHFPFCGHARHL